MIKLILKEVVKVLLIVKVVVKVVASVVIKIIVKSALKILLIKGWLMFCALGPPRGPRQILPFNAAVGRIFRQDFPLKGLQFFFSLLRLR